MTLQALIFDVGGVIVPHDNELLYRTLAARCSAPDAPERIRMTSAAKPYAVGALPITALHQRMAEELGYDGGWELFARDWCSHLGVDLAMLDFVGRLSQTNRVMLFSNTNQVHWDHVTALSEGALGAFEAYLSHEIGAQKPDVESFMVVAERAGIEPGRCLFFDDVMSNVEAARQAGFQAEQFTTQAALTASLRRRGVSWPDPSAGETR
jgi:putative hydrolase of the HAD superfamily